MPIIHIDSLNTPGVEVYHRLTDHQLRNRLHPEDGVIIVESPKVILTALSAGYEPLSLLCEARHLKSDAATILSKVGDIPVFTGERELLSQLTGYTLTRGVLCAMKRKTSSCVEAVCRDASRVVVIDGVSDTTNIGAIFRSAAALGVDAVLLTQDSCDPFNRRSIRVSMGSVFLVPWAWLDQPVDKGNPFGQLSALGFKTVAMALRDDSVSLDDPLLKAIPRLAIVMGTEGDGLPHSTIESTDYVVRIPMSHGVDSLNVAAAAAVAFWELASKHY